MRTVLKANAAFPSECGSGAYSRLHSHCGSMKRESRNERLDAPHLPMTRLAWNSACAQWCFNRIAAKGINARGALDPCIYCSRWRCRSPWQTQRAHDTMHDGCGAQGQRKPQCRRSLRRERGEHALSLGGSFRNAPSGGDPKIPDPSKSGRPPWSASPGRGKKGRRVGGSNPSRATPNGGGESGCGEPQPALSTRVDILLLQLLEVQQRARRVSSSEHVASMRNSSEAKVLVSR